MAGLAVAAMATGSTWMGSMGGVQIGVRREQVGQVFSRWVFVVQARAGLMGFGGMSAGVPLAEVTLMVLLGAKSRAGQMSMNEVQWASVVPSGSNSMQKGSDGTASGGGLMRVGWTGAGWTKTRLWVGLVVPDVVGVAHVVLSGPLLMQDGVFTVGSGGTFPRLHTAGLRPRASSTSVAQSSCWDVGGVL